VESKVKGERECPVYRTLNIVGKKWTLLILRNLSCNNKSTRFNELRRSLKEITSTTLSKRLREMEKDGLIKRSIITSEMPVKVEYSLTDKGRDLQKIVGDLKVWGLKWGFENRHEIMSCEICRKRMKDSGEC